MTRKGVVMLVVLGVLLVVSALVFASIQLMTQESRIAESKIKRIRALYAVQAGAVDAMAQLQSGVAPAAVAPTIVGVGIDGYPQPTVWNPTGGQVVTNTVIDLGGGNYQIDSTTAY